MKYLISLPVVACLLFVGCAETQSRKDVEDGKQGVTIAQDRIDKALPLAKQIVDKGAKPGSVEAKEITANLTEAKTALADTQDRLDAALKAIDKDTAKIAQAEAAGKRLPLLLVFAAGVGAASYAAGGLVKSVVVGMFPPALVVPSFVFGVGTAVVCGIGLYFLTALWIKLGWLFNLLT